jgi:hypothetical protein
MPRKRIRFGVSAVDDCAQLRELDLGCGADDDEEADDSLILRLGMPMFHELLESVVLWAEAWMDEWVLGEVITGTPRETVRIHIGAASIAGRLALPLPAWL